MTSKTEIMDTAECLLLKNGLKAVSLYDVADALQVSQPAIYKHFKNKQNLWAAVALRWMDETLDDLWKLPPGTSLHDWLWTLLSRKKTSRDANPALFDSYAHYIETTPDFLNSHMVRLAESLSATCSITDPTRAQAILRAFTWFHNPYFSKDWDDTYQEKFEKLWVCCHFD
ncbi:MAG: TetR/AcrR family transcriptional regulator [Streptococcaceae bacterium]|jgi:AcrR family transcriptional regulator|nr:TetR/AcrR family transcriptional regulator [Streptococcaceae bacterium]